MSAFALHLANFTSYGMRPFIRVPIRHLETWTTFRKWKLISNFRLNKLSKSENEYGLPYQKLGDSAYFLSKTFRLKRKTASIVPALTLSCLT